MVAGSKPKGFQSDMDSDKTTVTTIAEGSITRLPGRIVPILQVTTGAEQGRLLSLLQYNTVRIGRSKECELVVHDPSCSRIHVEVYVDQGSLKVYLKDLGSRNGTKLNGKKVGNEPVKLGDGDRIQLGEQTILRFTLMPEDDAQVQMEVYLRATRDRLTNAFNRHQFDEALDRELSYQKRVGHGLAIVIFDVDHFKRVNDTYGHPAGDAVLKEIGQRVPTCIRIEDIFARIGGEEFALLVRSDSLEGVKILAERLRSSMEKKPVDASGAEIHFTVSIGVLYIKGKDLPITPAQVIETADQALYEAKEAGRNRIIYK